jgi:hypothetical protein
MTQVTHYQQASWGTHNKMKQDELQEMAKKIATCCKLTDVTHHTYGTNNKEQCKNGEEFAHIMNGSMALRYESEHLPLRYSVHVNCGIVTEIIEMIEM